jgi:GNAT superfamily N-acetyltransferase
MARWRIEPLARSHERAAFECGQPSLDEFLRTYVTQYEKRRLGRTYVAVVPGRSQVLGYYTLASSAVPLRNLPAPLARKLPAHPVPVALLARLAVDLRCRGEGLGRHLLMDALHRCLELSAALGIHAVEVLAIDGDAASFYGRYGFVALLDDSRHMFLPLATLAQAFGRAER